MRFEVWSSYNKAPSKVEELVAGAISLDRKKSIGSTSIRPLQPKTKPSTGEHDEHNSHLEERSPPDDTSDFCDTFSEHSEEFKSVGPSVDTQEDEGSTFSRLTNQESLQEVSIDKGNAYHTNLSAISALSANSTDDLDDVTEDGGEEDMDSEKSDTNDALQKLRSMRMILNQQKDVKKVVQSKVQDTVDIQRVESNLSKGSQRSKKSIVSKTSQKIKNALKKSKKATDKEKEDESSQASSERSPLEALRAVRKQLDSSKVAAKAVSEKMDVKTPGLPPRPAVVVSDAKEPKRSTLPPRPPILPAATDETQETSRLKPGTPEMEKAIMEARRETFLRKVAARKNQDNLEDSSVSVASAESGQVEVTLHFKEKAQPPSLLQTIRQFRKLLNDEAKKPSEDPAEKEPETEVSDPDTLSPPLNPKVALKSGDSELTESVASALNRKPSVTESVAESFASVDTFGANLAASLEKKPVISPEQEALMGNIASGCEQTDAAVESTKTTAPNIQSGDDVSSSNRFMPNDGSSSVAGENTKESANVSDEIEETESVELPCLAGHPTLVSTVGSTVGTTDIVVDRSSTKESAEIPSSTQPMPETHAAELATTGSVSAETEAEKVIDERQVTESVEFPSSNNTTPDIQSIEVATPESIALKDSVKVDELQAADHAMGTDSIEVATIDIVAKESAKVDHGCTETRTSELLPADQTPGLELKEDVSDSCNFQNPPSQEMPNADEHRDEEHKPDAELSLQQPTLEQENANEDADDDEKPDQDPSVEVVLKGYNTKNESDNRALSFSKRKQGMVKKVFNFLKKKKKPKAKAKGTHQASLKDVPENKATTDDPHPPRGFVGLRPDRVCCSESQGDDCEMSLNTFSQEQEEEGSHDNLDNSTAPGKTLVPFNAVDNLCCNAEDTHPDRVPFEAVNHKPAMRLIQSRDTYVDGQSVATRPEEAAPLESFPTNKHRREDVAMTALDTLSLDAADLVSTLGEEVFGTAPKKKTGMFVRHKSKPKEPVVDLSAIDVKDIERQMKERRRRADDSSSRDPSSSRGSDGHKGVSGGASVKTNGTRKSDKDKAARRRPPADRTIGKLAGRAGTSNRPRSSAESDNTSYTRWPSEASLFLGDNLANVDRACEWFFSKNC